MFAELLAEANDDVFVRSPRQREGEGGNGKNEKISFSFTLLVGWCWTSTWSFAVDGRWSSRFFFLRQWLSCGNHLNVIFIFIFIYFDSNFCVKKIQRLLWFSDVNISLKKHFKWWWLFWSYPSCQTSTTAIYSYKQDKISHDFSSRKYFETNDWINSDTIFANMFRTQEAHSF